MSTKYSVNKSNLLFHSEGTCIGFIFEDLDIEKKETVTFLTERKKKQAFIKHLLSIGAWSNSQN